MNENANERTIRLQKAALLALIGLCSALSAGTATSRAVLGPTLYSPRTAVWTMLLAFLLVPWVLGGGLSRTSGSGAVGGAAVGALTGALSGGLVGLFAVLSLAGANREVLTSRVPVPLAWLAVLGSSLTGVLWGAAVGLPLGAFALGVGRAILDMSEKATAGGSGRERRR